MKKANGICVCCKTPAAPGRVQCEEHLVLGSERMARYLDRRDARRAA